MTGTPAPGIATRPRRGMAAAAFALAFAVASLRGAAALSASAALLAFAPTAAAQASDPAPLRFRDGAEEARFHALVSQLRCVMCQNQSLADSNAQIAHDLRREVLDLMREGRSDADIERFLVARYGEFVLYRPRVESKTWLLWFGPALLLLAGGVVVARIVRRHGPGNDNGSTEADDGQEW
jgi:cytochrome c-type biogenesis protein CcmH